MPLQLAAFIGRHHMLVAVAWSSAKRRKWDSSVLRIIQTAILVIVGSRVKTACERVQPLMAMSASLRGQGIAHHTSEPLPSATRYLDCTTCLVNSTLWRCCPFQRRHVSANSLKITLPSDWVELLILGNLTTLNFGKIRFASDKNRPNRIVRPTTFFDFSSARP